MSRIYSLLFIVSILFSGCEFLDPPSPPSIGAIRANPSLAYTGDFIVFEVSEYGGTAPIGYVWDFGDGTTSASIKPSHQFELPGEYAVSVIVSNEAGSVQETVIIEVRERLGSIYFWNNSPVYGPTTVILKTQTGNRSSTTSVWYSQDPGCARDIGNAQFLGLPYGTYLFEAAGAVGGYWSGQVTLSDGCETFLLY